MKLLLDKIGIVAKVLCDDRSESPVDQFFLIFGEQML
jgi:hypothetical protein